jgi:hypothetical protein
LSGRTFDSSRFEPWLVSGKVDMWALVYDEWILILERIAPYSLSVDFFHFIGTSLTQSVWSSGCTISPSQQMLHHLQAVITR